MEPSTTTTSTDGKSRSEAQAKVVADSVNSTVIADVNKSLPHPKGQEAASIKENIDDKKADAQLGSGAKDQEVYFVKDEVKVSKELDKSVDPKATIYFKGCKDSNYIINSRCVKVMIEACQRCSFTFKGRIYTNTIEAWKTVDVAINILNDQVKTLQVDMTSRMTITFDTRTSFHSIIWSGVNDMKLKFADEESFLYNTGFEQMKKQYEGSELSFTVDQFTTREIKGEFLTEQIVRLANGYPTTEREAKEFDNNQEANAKRAEEFIRNKLKENGINLGSKGQNNQKLAGRNDTCPCGSGKKNKKCCNK